MTIPSEIIISQNDSTRVEAFMSDNRTGRVNTYNKFGNIVTSLATTKDEDGSVFLNDRYGDLGTSVIGKK